MNKNISQKSVKTSTEIVGCFLYPPKISITINQERIKSPIAILRDITFILLVKIEKKSISILPNITRLLSLLQMVFSI